MKTFTVISAADFLSAGPPIGSREFKQQLAAEEKQKRDRLRRQQQQTDDWHAKRSRMNPRQTLAADLAAFDDFLSVSTDALEREYQLLQGDSSNGQS